jgi:hypothetical protein
MKTLTEVDNYDASVTVPEGGDPRSNAAEAVEAIAQVFADRTLNLKNRADGAAYLAVANVFTGVPQYVDSADCEIAQREIVRSSLDEPTNSSNAWKLIDNLASDHSARRVRIYAGGNNATGMFAITVNAFWHKSDQHWRHDVSSNDSLALMIKGEQMVLTRQLSSVGAWTAWPTDKGDTVIGGDYLYAAQKPRTTLINIANVTGPVIRNSDGSYTLDSSFTGPIAFPVWLPAGAIILKVNVLALQHDAAQAPLFKFVARPQANWPPSSATATLQFARDSQSGPAATGMQFTVLDPSAGGGGYGVDPTLEEYAVTYELQPSGTSMTAPLDAVHGIQVVWTAAGPGDAV